MKRLASLIPVLFFLITLIGCENKNVSILKKEVANANATCPINLGIGGDLISVKYQQKENRVILYYSINEELAGGIFLKQNKERMHQYFRLLLSNSESKKMLKDMVNAKASLMTIYKSPSTGKTVKFEVPYIELKDIYANPISDSEIQKLTIENLIDMSNARCPLKIEEGVTLTKIDLLDDNLVCYYETDEDIYDMNELKLNQSYLKESQQESFESMRNDLTMQNDLKSLIALNKGYQFRYFGNKTKKFVDVIFTPEELSQILNK